MVYRKKTIRQAAVLPAVAVCVALLGAFFNLSVRAADDVTASLATATLTPATLTPVMLTPVMRPSADAAGDADEELWAVHAQLSNITQKHNQFNAPYSGPNSLSPQRRVDETSDITLFAGLRLWRGAELWLNPELDQGFGFDNTLGVAGFPNGAAYKLGANTPYWRLQRAVVRQLIPLGGAVAKVASAANQLAGSQSADQLILTVGKFAVVDLFDTNTYAHDPRADFLNWSMIDSAAFDYAADSWGYTFGAAAEWQQSWWTLRGGVFQLSAVPNGKVIGLHASQYELLVEAEARHQWHGHAGKVKLLAYTNHGNMGSYRDALALSRQTASTPDTARVRRISSTSGMALNIEQELANELGGFVRLSAHRGSKETYEFTDVNRSLALGLSLQGARWGRPDDTVGAGAVVNALSDEARAYFAAGGLGVLVGDGRLRYAPEKIVEFYYALHPFAHLTLTVDYQHVLSPAYNQDRGPVSIYGVRAHAEF